MEFILSIMLDAAAQAQEFKNAAVNQIIRTHGNGELLAGAFEDRMVPPTPENPYGFPSETHGSEPMPEGFETWDEKKQNAYFRLPMVDI